MTLHIIRVAQIRRIWGVESALAVIGTGGHIKRRRIKGPSPSDAIGPAGEYARLRATRLGQPGNMP
eukprot:2933044-Pyramimonas_sp.AAC.1